jgi:hypothetical protein
VLAGHWAHREVDVFTFDYLVEIHEALAVQREMERRAIEIRNA